MYTEPMVENLEWSNGLFHKNDAALVTLLCPRGVKLFVALIYRALVLYTQNLTGKPPLKPTDQNSEIN